MTATDWTAIGTGVTALATALLVWGAFAAWHAARDTLEQMKEDSKLQTRPYVHVRLEPSIGKSRAWDVVLSNTGRTIAQNVRFEVTPWPTREDLVTRDMATLSNSGQHLAPNTHIRTYWYLGPVPDQDTRTNRGFEGEHTVTVHYENQENERYTDIFALDESAFKMTPLGGMGVNLGDQASDEAKKLSEILRAINELRR